jgi:hypothetical protein
MAHRETKGHRSVTGSLGPEAVLRQDGDKSMKAIPPTAASMGAKANYQRFRVPEIYPPASHSPLGEVTSKSSRVARVALLEASLDPNRRPPGSPHGVLQASNWQNLEARIGHEHEIHQTIVGIRAGELFLDRKARSRHCARRCLA